MSKIVKSEDGKSVIIDDITYSLDESGNALDNENKVKFTVEDLSKIEDITPKKDDDPIQTSKIEIEGIVYSIDKEGNAIDDKGQVKFTKTQLEDFVEDDVTPPANTDLDISAISKLSGIEVKDENGNEIPFQLTVEDLAKRESMIKTIGEQEGFNKGFNEFLKENPDIADIINYKNNYGTVEGYNSSIDYFKITVADDDESNYHLIYTAEIQRGKNPNDAKRFADFCKSDKRLKEDAISALNYLQTQQKNKLNTIREQQEQAILAKIEEEERYFGVRYDNKTNKEVPLNIKGSIYDMVVNAGVLGNFKIPETGITVKTDKGFKQYSRKDIFDYISKPVTEVNGNYYTQAQLDEINKMSKPEEWILRCISNLNGGLNQLVQNTVQSEKVEIIKRLKNKSTMKKNNTTKDVDTKKIIW
jgi:hypothetical protein